MSTTQPPSSPRAPASVAHLLDGPILATLLRSSWPNLVAMLATATAAVAETTYVGRLGVNALAGMALVFPLVMLQQMFSSGAMGGGVSSAVSRALGAGDTQRAGALAVHAVWIGLSLGLAYMGVMLLFGERIFVALGGQGEPLRQAVAYANVAFLGSVGVWLMNTFASVLRGTGNMAVPSSTIFAVAVLQVVAGGLLGLGFGPVPALGMPGVAAGQVLAYGSGALVLGAWVLSGRSRVRLDLLHTPVQWPMLREILRVGALACISPAQSVATVLIVTALVARFGPVALAGYGIGARLEFLLVPIAFAFGVASAPMVGMAIGARQVQRARQVAWAAAWLSFGVMGVLGLLLALAPGLWTGQFTNNQAVLEAAALYFHWAGPCYGLFGMGLCMYFSSLGAGKPGGPVLAGTLRLVLVAAGGLALAQAQAPTWGFFAMVALAMAAYGLMAVWLVRRADWGPGQTAR